MKILIASHAYSALPNQQKLENFAQDQTLQVFGIMPDSWRAILGGGKNKTDLPFVSLLPIYFPGKNDRYFYSPLKLFKAITKIRPEIIQVEEEPWSFSCLQLLVLGKILGAKVIFFTWENVWRKHKWFYALIEKINLFLANGAIAGNAEAKEILEKKKFKKPVLLNPQFGVDPNFFKPGKNEVLKKELGLTKYTLGFFARFDVQKGLKLLIEAVKDLDVQVLFIGTGPLEDWLREEARNDARLKIVGLVSHKEVPKYFQAIDCLVLPSLTTTVWKEQFGHTIIEAMSAEVPVIASNSGAIPEVVSNAGILFQEGDAFDLKEKIAKLKENINLQKELAVKGKERILQNYTHDKIREKTVGFYQKILQSPP